MDDKRVVGSFTRRWLGNVVLHAILKACNSHLCTGVMVDGKLHLQ